MAAAPEDNQMRLVIALDYGTTHTGLAWATPTGSRLTLDEIKVVHDWGARMGNHPKVPSVISYSAKTDDNERQCQQWGSDLSTNAIAMVHTKLQLDVDNTSKELEMVLQELEGMQNLEFDYIKKTEAGSRYTTKGPEQIVEDYLTKVFGFCIKSVDRFSEEFLRLTPVDIVITVPVQWGYRARNATFRALTRAGFNRDTFRELKEMLLVTEPEAAAIYAARYLKEKIDVDFLPKIHECFVLCDAGGGTVDVASYKVKQLEPYFEVERIGVPIGEKYGSIFINLAFKTWLRDFIGKERYQEIDQKQISYKLGSHNTEGARMRTLMKDFEKRKKLFTTDGRDIRIDLPEPFEDLDLPGRVDQGQITITYKTMQSFFAPCVEHIIGLIKSQANDIAECEGRRLKNVFLVGGFAESPYLQACIRNSLDLLSDSIQLRIPDTSLTAVVRGAALFGVEKLHHKSIPKMSACPRSYGVSVNVPFSEIIHDPNDRETDPLTRIDMAKGQLRWLIEKGELILSNQMKEATHKFTKNFIDSRGKAGSLPIYAYDEDDLPDRLFHARNEVTPIGTLEYDLSDYSLDEFEPRYINGRTTPFYVAFLSLKMRVAPGFLRVQLCMKDRVIKSMKFPQPLLAGLDTPKLPE